MLKRVKISPALGSEHPIVASVGGVPPTWLYDLQKDVAVQSRQYCPPACYFVSVRKVADDVR